MKERVIKTPAGPRYTIQEIVDPVYISRDQFECMNYIPDEYRRRLIIVDFIKEEMTLEEKIQKAHKVELHYDAPYEYKFAVVEYYARQGKPLKVVSYYIYGEELKTGKPLRCWTGYPSTNWSVLEDDFATYAEAEVRMKEIKEARRGE